MNSGLYSAYSGLRANANMLEVLANNLANLNTTGFKGDETFFRLYNRTVGESQMLLDQAINDFTVVQGTVINFQGGPLTTTGRDLDVAIEGARILCSANACRSAIHAERPFSGEFPGKAGNRPRL